MSGSIPGPGVQQVRSSGCLSWYLSSFRHMWRYVTLGRRGQYNLAEAERSTHAEQRCTLVKAFQRFWSCRGYSRDNLSDEERFHLALYTEGLLADKFIVDEQTNPKSPTILLVNDCPVLNICHGFKNGELRVRGSRRALYGSYRNCYGPSVRVGLDKVLMDGDDVDDEPEVDNIPVSLWMEVLEPAIDILLELKSGRSNRLNITHRRRASLLGPIRVPRVVIGDVQATFFMQGPIVNPGQHRGGLFSMLNNRQLELGGWTRPLRNAGFTDSILPVDNNGARDQNISRSRVTLSDPQARRHGINIANRITETQDDITVSENHVRPPRRFNMVFH